MVTTINFQKEVDADAGAPGYVVQQVRYLQIVGDQTEPFAFPGDLNCRIEFAWLDRNGVGDVSKSICREGAGLR